RDFHVTRVQTCALPISLTLAWPRLKDYGFIIVIPPAACTIAWLWAHDRRWLPNLAIAGLLAAIVTLTREHPETANDDYRPPLLLDRQSVVEGEGGGRR